MSFTCILFSIITTGYTSFMTDILRRIVDNSSVLRNLPKAPPSPDSSLDIPPPDINFSLPPDVYMQLLHCGVDHTIAARLAYKYVSSVKELEMTTRQHASGALAKLARAEMLQSFDTRASIIRHYRQKHAQTIEFWAKRLIEQARQHTEHARRKSTFNQASAENGHDAETNRSLGRPTFPSVIHDPHDVLNPPAPAHAYPTPYDPVNRPTFFPHNSESFISLHLEWYRLPAKPQNIRHACINDISSEFGSKLYLRGRSTQTGLLHQPHPYSVRRARIQKSPSASPHWGTSPVSDSHLLRPKPIPPIDSNVDAFSKYLTQPTMLAVSSHTTAERSPSPTLPSQSHHYVQPTPKPLEPLVSSTPHTSIYVELFAKSITLTSMGKCTYRDAPHMCHILTSANINRNYDYNRSHITSNALPSNGIRRTQHHAIVSGHYLLNFDACTYHMYICHAKPGSLLD
uniref:HD2 protein n=1 Tax=Volvariella volvacea TaxID=36659 RepID=A0A1B2U735_9AGAR|nr:HD2 protein [Volvariella volvacea]